MHVRKRIDENDFVGQYTGYKNFINLKPTYYFNTSSKSSSLVKLVMLTNDLKLKVAQFIHMIVDMRMNAVLHHQSQFQDRDSLQLHDHDVNARHPPVKIPFDRMKPFLDVIIERFTQQGDL